MPSSKIFASTDFLESNIRPSTINDAEEKISTIKLDLQKISTQLADKRRQEKMEWSNEEYGQWRHRAIHARNIKTLQMAYLANWIEKERARRGGADISVSTPKDIVGRLVDILDRIIFDRALILNESEQNFISAAKNYANE